MTFSFNVAQSKFINQFLTIHDEKHLSTTVCDSLWGVWQFVRWSVLELIRREWKVEIEKSYKTITRSRAFFVPNLGNRTNIVPSRIRYTGLPVTTPLKYCLHLKKANVVSNHLYHNRQHYYHHHNQKLLHCHCHIYSRIVIILLMLSDSYRLPIQLFP